MGIDIIIEIIIVVLSVLCIPCIIGLIFAPFYFKFGFCKKFFHDVLGWHTPTETEKNTFIGCSMRNHCKFCGKEIMKDSQGNWF